MSTWTKGKLGMVVLASFVVHTLLLVTSATTTLQAEQDAEGRLLANQLAQAATQAAVAHDLVTLSLLIQPYQNQPNIAAVHIRDSKNTMLAGADNDAVAPGRSFNAAIAIPGEASGGKAEVVLSDPSRGEIMHRNQGALLASAGLHVAMLVAALLLVPASRRPAVAAATDSNPDTAPRQPVALLQVSIADPNNLMMRVNAATADEMLTVLDHLLDRAARLYGGQVVEPFSPAGTLVAFYDDDPVERAYRALVCGQLFLSLVSGADLQRRAAGLFSLPVKAGLHHAGDDTTEERRIAVTIAQTAPTGRLLCSTDGVDSEALDRCQLGQRLKLAVGAGRELPIVVIERLQAEFQQLVHDQTQRLLGLTAAGLRVDAAGDAAPAS